MRIFKQALFYHDQLNKYLYDEFSYHTVMQANRSKELFFDVWLLNISRKRLLFNKKYGPFFTDNSQTIKTLGIGGAVNPSDPMMDRSKKTSADNMLRNPFIESYFNYTYEHLVSSKYDFKSIRTSNNSLNPFNLN